MEETEQDDLDDEQPGPSSRMRDPSLGAVVRREGDSSSGDLTCRQARNNAEKARRDRVSSSINQMTAFVNVLKQSPKKIDKITILRVVANHVRLHKLSSMVFESREDGGLGAVPSALGEHIESLVLEDTKSVAFVVSSTNGKIVYVTKTVENVLGHTQVELFGQEFKRLVHEDDQDIIKAALQPLSSDGTPLKALEPASSDESSSDDTGTSTSMSSQDSPLPGRSTPSAAPPPPSESQKRSFKFRIQQRPVSRSDSPQYEEVNADGFLWVPGRVVATGTSAESSQGRRRRSTDDPEANSCLLLMMIKLVRETRGGLQALSIGMNRNEYLTRHMPNGCFLTTDFRISLVSGYLPEEVVGVDAFTYMHPEDAKWAHVALQYMLMHAEETGYSCYRLRSKTGDYIHLKTCGYLEKNDEGKIVSFICINSLVTEEEAAIAKAQMQKRFAPHFSSFQQPRESGVRIVELSDDELQHDRETIQAILPPYNVSATESSSLPPPSPELQPRPSSSSSFHGSVPGRESVLHMAGDVRRTQGRKRSSESELQPQKRVCSTSPGHTPTSPSSSLSPRSLTLRASSASPALPGPSALSPDLSSGLDLNSPGVLEDVMVDPYPAADVFPNVEWGRQGGPEDAAPAPLAVAAPDQDLLDLAHIEVPMDPYLAGDVTQGSIFLVEKQINGIPISTHCPNPQETSSMTLQQTQIGNSLQVQGQQMLTIQTGLNQVPPNNPERHRLENELYLAKEEHIRQGKELHNLQEETRRANQQTYC